MIRCVALMSMVLATGCDYILGLGRFDRPGIDAAPLPPGPAIVQGALVERYATNSGTAPIALTRAFAASEVTFKVKLLDDSDPALAYNESDGTFTFHRTAEDQPYSLSITANGRTTEYQHVVAQLDLAVLVAGRSNPTPIAKSDLTFGYPDQASSGANGYSPAIVATTGQWSQTDTATYGPAIVFDWRQAQAVGGVPVGLLDMAADDRVYVYGNSLALGYTAIAVASPGVSITQHPNQSTTLPTAVPVAPNACIRFTSNSLDEQQRIMAAQPRAYVSTPLEADWIVLAVPTSSVGLAGAMNIASIGYAPPRNIVQTAPFYDPFNNHEHWVEAGAIAYLSFKLATTATPFYAANTTRRYQPIATASPASCTQPMTPVTTTIALPGAISLAGMLLSNDDLASRLDLTKDVPVTWELAAPAPVDHARVTLFELVNIANATKPMLLQSIDVVKQTALLDRTRLQIGHTYMLLIQSYLKFQAATTGDFNTPRAFFEQSEVFSHSFVVTQ